MPTAVLPDRNLAKAMWLNGICASQISSQLGVKVSTIRQWVVRYGWKRDAKTEQPVTEQIQAAVRQDVAARITALAIDQAERLMAVIRDNKIKTLSDSKTAASALAASYATARKALGLDDTNAPQQHLHVHVMRGAQPRVAAAADLAVIDAQVLDSAPSQVPDESANPNSPGSDSTA